MWGQVLVLIQGLCDRFPSLGLSCFTCKPPGEVRAASQVT